MTVTSLTQKKKQLESKPSVKKLKGSYLGQMEQRLKTPRNIIIENVDLFEESPAKLSIKDNKTFRMKTQRNTIIENIDLFDDSPAEPIQTSKKSNEKKGKEKGSKDKRSQEKGTKIGSKSPQKSNKPNSKTRNININLNSPALVKNRTTATLLSTYTNSTLKKSPRTIEQLTIDISSLIIPAKGAIEVAQNPRPQKQLINSKSTIVKSANMLKSKVCRKK